NGLICAAYLARAGVDTLLLEARDEVGGCASTVGDLDARFNICSCDHTLVRAMPFMDDLDLAAHGLRYLEADPSTVYLDHDGNPPWLFFNDSERTIESIGRHRPAQAKAYRRYLADARPVAELALEIGTGPASTPRMLARVLARRGRGGIRLLQWSRASAVDVLRSYFDDEAVVMPGISNGPSVWGVPPDAAGTGLAGAAYAMRHMVKTGRPVGGSGALTEALAASFVAAGGRLSCGTPVAGLLGDGRAVTGVRLADGTEVSAEAVVSACDPVVVASQWLPDPERRSARRFVDRARSQAPGEGYQSKIDAVVTDVPRYPVLEDSNLLDLFEGRDPAQSNYVISPSMTEVLEAHRLRRLGRVAERPTMMANVPSVLDPSMCSRDGHHVLSLEALFTPYAVEGGWEGSKEPARWLQVWSRQLQPGFLESIDRYRTMTPDRYERELFLGRGYTPSYAGSPLATLFGRRRELSRYRPPVPGLFLSGAGTFPGAGIWGASGRNAANAVLRTLN
ncbi:MAG: NAD(P)/FAD-dependent oxidoreductase, partial [Acidimicrobiaceae bacterium]|nr:NAD(P)/FAD-dependent oxidoreductase [Acidimicrobiaceae bacterium]